MPSPAEPAPLREDEHARVDVEAGAEHALQNAAMDQSGQGGGGDGDKERVVNGQAWGEGEGGGGERRAPPLL
jgi:hypothetical protein